MAHALWRAVLREGDTAIDATMGNGWDTLILAKLVLRENIPDQSFGGDEMNPTQTEGGDRCSTRGRVVAFDIQQAALDSTRAKVEEQLTPGQAARVNLVLGSHDTLENHVKDGNGGDQVGVVCFNLGYLPGVGSDKTVVTQVDSTVKAVQAAVKVLRPGGVLTVVGRRNTPHHDCAVWLFCVCVTHAQTSSKASITQEKTSDYTVPDHCDCRDPSWRIHWSRGWFGGGGESIGMRVQPRPKRVHCL